MISKEETIVRKTTYGYALQAGFKKDVTFIQNIKHMSIFYFSSPMVFLITIEWFPFPSKITIIKSISYFQLAAYYSHFTTQYSNRHPYSSIMNRMKLKNLLCFSIAAMKENPGEIKFLKIKLKRQVCRFRTINCCNSFRVNLMVQA